MIAAITPPFKEPLPLLVSPPEYQRKDFWLLSFFRYILHVFTSNTTISTIQGRGSLSRREEYKSADGFEPRALNLQAKMDLLRHRLSRARKADSSALSNCVMETRNAAITFWGGLQVTHHLALLIVTFFIFILQTSPLIQVRWVGCRKAKIASNL